MTTLRALCGAIAGAVVMAGASTAVAEGWPTRAMQVISPFTAGNANDIVARVVLDQVSRQLGQTFIIENRPGGGGTLGAAMVATAEPLRLAAGINVQHIPFRWPVEAFTEVMSGRIDYYFLPIAPALPVIGDGKVVALAVSTPKRAPALPNVPTTAEAGYPDAVYLFWGGLSVPAKTPRAIIDKLHHETQKALNMPAIQERLAKLSVQPQPISVDEFDKFFRDDLAAAVKLGKDAHI